MQPNATRKDFASRITGSRSVFLYTLITAIFSTLLVSIGTGGELIDRVLASIHISLNSIWIPILYLLGAMGLGCIARRWTARLSTRWVIELGIGLTITLTLTHGLGVMGLLRPTSAWIVTGVGCLLLLLDFKQHAPQLNNAIGHTSITIPRLAFVLGCALVVMMSLNPPGASWDSEYGSYDVLSYHLELPREWLEAGRIWPYEHNVYSFLPGYIESAYLHFAYLAGVPQTTPQGLSGFLANDARVAMSTQLFSALLTIISAIAMHSLVCRAIELYLPDTRRQDQSTALCARVLMVCTPWLAVVGSIAYNEMGVVLLGICAFAVCIEKDSSICFRSIATSLIVAGACSVKPTALFLLAPSIGVILLTTIPFRQWWKPLILGSFIGFLTLSPWLLRNHIATGNIVFPQMTSLFGDGHWSPNQHAVYADSHRFDGSIFDRLKLLIVPDSAGLQHVSRFRGFTNMHWALTPWIGFAGWALLIAQSRTRRLGVVLMAAIAFPIVGWMLLTHLQSRFLIPMAPILIGTGSLGFASLPFDSLRSGLVKGISVIVFGWTVLTASRQVSGDPFMLIDLGTPAFTGEIETSDTPWPATLNTLVEPDETIYLLGDATPFYLRSPFVYNTVYDRWLIEDAAQAHPGDPSMWTPFLQSHGIDLVVISYYEIYRFTQSGWLPDSMQADHINEWINSLGEPIYKWTVPGYPKPIRAAFRISQDRS